jgi:hypothetical protein
MRDDLDYIATVTHHTISLGEPILKDTKDYLRSNPNVTVKDLLAFLLKEDSGWEMDQKNIESLVRRNIEEVQKNPAQLFLGLRMTDGKGEYTVVPANVARSGGNQGVVFLKDTVEAEPLYLENKSPEGKSYMGLHLVVTGTEGGGRGDRGVFYTQ